MSSKILGFSIRLLVTTTILLWGFGVHAQSIQYGKITGIVIDESDNPVPGVRVDIYSEALISGSRSTTSSENGTYVFLNVPIGTYRVNATLTGFKTLVQDNVPVGAGAVATVDFTMQMGGVEESITVTDTAVLIDKHTSTVETKFDENFLKNLPTARDAFYDLSLTAPGMFDAGRDSSWLPSPTAYGSGSNENAFLVNGVDATSPRGGGFGSLVNVNYDTVEEVRLIALGSKAEYGSATGVTMDVVTKSGSNNYHGKASVYSQLGKPADNTPDSGDDLGADWVHLAPNSSLLGRTEKDREFAFTVGGPILTDKVWFFGGLNFLGVDNNPPLWTVTGENDNRYYDFKVSAEPMKDHSAWIAYHFERNKNDGSTWGDAVPWDPTLTYGNKTKNDTISTQWQWLPSSKSIVTAKYLGFWTDINPHLPDNAPANSGFINWWKWKEFGVNGHFPYIEAGDSSRHTVQADMTQYVEDFLGQQDIKFGVQYTTGHGNDIGGYWNGYANFAYPGGYYYYQGVASIEDMQGYFDYVFGQDGFVWFNWEYHTPPFETAKSFKNTGVFIDDQWTISPRLTLNLGVRFDKMTNKYDTGKVFVQPEGIHFDVNDLQVASDRQGTGNVFDFTNVSPRIGATYSLNDKTVVRGNYGRYFAPVGLENLRRLGPNLPLQTIRTNWYNVPWDQADLNGDGLIDSDELTSTARLLHDLTPYLVEETEVDNSWEARVAADTKNQHVDQFTFNFEREVAKDLSFSATYIHKSTGNILVNVPINRQTGEDWEYERVPYTTSQGADVNLYGVVLQDYNGDGSVDAGDVEFVHNNTDYEVRNLETLDGIDPKRTYDGIQFVLNKRFSDRAQMMGSFLYSHSDGLAHRDNIPFQDVNIQGPMIFDTNFVGSLNQTLNNLEGPLPFTPKYEVKISGSYLIPRIESDFGLRVRYHSGRPIVFSEGIPTLQTWNFGTPGAVLDPGGSPLIVGTPADDVLWLPAATLIDLRFARAFSLGNSQRMLVAIDCFNILNTGSVTNVDTLTNLGEVTAITSPSRKFRLGLSYEF